MSGALDFLTGKSGEDAAVASRDAASIAARGQEEALDYLKQTEEIPQHFRESALSQLAGLFGIQLPESYYTKVSEDEIQARIADELGARPEAGGGRLFSKVAPDLWDKQAEEIRQSMMDEDRVMDRPKSAESFLAGLEDTPLYQSIMGTRKAGEESLLRTASATGGLRSGNVQSNMYDFNQRLQERAVLESYEDQKRGLAGLAGIPSMAPQIAQATAAPGMTRAQGITAGAQAEQAGTAGLMQGLFNVGGSVLGGMAMAGAFCDSRLKKNVKPAGERLGYKWYTWDWNDKAEELGLTGPGEGVMAHEVAEINPEAVGVGKTGYLLVDYGALV